MRANRTKIPYFLALMCCLLNVPVLAGVQGQSAAFVQDFYKIGAFVVSDSGRLHRVVLDLQSQNAVWEDLGGDGVGQLRPTVASDYDHLAFVISANGDLYSALLDDGAWQWYYNGNPGVALSGNMSKINYVYNGTENDAVFVVGDDDSLYVYWQRDYGEWQWSALGGTALTHYVSAVSYEDKNGNLHLEVYVVGGDGNLYVKFWDGNAWQWNFVGRPDVSVSVAFPFAQMSDDYTEEVFVVGSDGHLYSVDISNTWVDRGGSQLAKPPAGLPLHDGTSSSAFIVGGDGALYKNTSGTSWTSPGACGLQPFVSPINSGADGYWIFVIDDNGSFLAIADTIAVPCWHGTYGYDLSAYPGAP